MADLSNKTYVVVGGSSGIGLALTRTLAERGAQVQVWSRRRSDELDELMQSHGTISHQELDVLQELDAAELSIPEDVSGLAYCPGSISLGSFRQLKPDQYREDYEINVIGAVKVLKLLLQSLSRNGGGAVVMFSTVASQIGLSFHASIAAAKGAVQGLARTLAAELAGKNIRVNVIAPSATDTPLAAGVLGSDKKRESSAERHPLKRVGDAAEVAETASFLLSDDAGWITGQILGVDGGLATARP